jgi:predicted RNA binding protein YcfA (HicA-like mRNA interferase family)
MAKDVRGISVRDLVEKLRSLGFVNQTKSGSHLVLRHSRSGLLLTVPTDRPFVPLVHVRAIQEQLRNYRISFDEFDQV